MPGLQSQPREMCWQLLGTVRCPGLLVWSGGCWGALTFPLVEKEVPGAVEVASVASKATWWQLRLGEGLVIAKFVKP